MADEKNRRRVLGSTLDLDLKKLVPQEPDVIRQLRTAAESFDKTYRDPMRSLMEPFERLQKMYEDPLGLKALQAQVNYGRQFAAVLEPYRRYQQTMEQLIGRYQPYTPVFNEMALAGAFQRPTTERILAEAERLLTSLSVERISPTSVLIDGEELSLAEAEEEVQRAWEGTAALPLEQRVDAATATLTSTRSNRAILAFLVFSLLAGMFWAAAETPIQMISDPATKPVARRIVRWLQENYNYPREEVPAELRVVTTNDLAVREHARQTNSRKLGTVNIGDVVEVLEKQKDWTLIVSVDDPDLRGWVFSRYLVKVRVPRASVDQKFERDGQFDAVVSRVLEKNAELYRRLS